jgi:hypothetical protein
MRSQTFLKWAAEKALRPPFKVKHFHARLGPMGGNPPSLDRGRAPVLGHTRQAEGRTGHHRGPAKAECIPGGAELRNQDRRHRGQDAPEMSARSVVPSVLEKLDPYLERIEAGRHGRKIAASTREGLHHENCR